MGAPQLRVDRLAQRLAEERRAQRGQGEDAGRPGATEMVRNVAADLETLNVSLRALETSAGAAGDAATQNLAQGYADGQEKTIWMLRAFLEG